MGMYKESILALLISVIPLVAFAQKGEHLSRKAQKLAAQETPSTVIRQLQRSGTDSIISFRYDTDNGVAKQAVHYIAWVENKRGYIKTFTDYGERLISTRSETKLEEIFSLYTQGKIKTLPKLKSCNQSHDMGYYVSVYLPSEVFRYAIRDCQRHQMLISNDLLPGEVAPEPTEDPRSVLLDLFERLVK
jgi:hypothetical protein